MRGLIRPTLFWVVRIGLFLSVAAWIAGQWRLISFHAPNGLDVGFRDESWSVAQLRLGPWWSLEAKPLAEWDASLKQIRKSIQELATDGVYPPSYREWTCPGLQLKLALESAAGNAFVSDFHIEIRHWLIITTFALFYAVLKWVYRKPEVSDE